MICTVQSTTILFIYLFIYLFIFYLLLFFFFGGGGEGGGGGEIMYQYNFTNINSGRSGGRGTSGTPPPLILIDYVCVSHYVRISDMLNIRMLKNKAQIAWESIKTLELPGTFIGPWTPAI